jgi:tetratricopeptide (TPR) repeat protein
MNLLLHVHVAWHWLLAGDAQSALDQACHVVAIDPQFHWGHYFTGWAAGTLGDVSRAVDSMRSALTCANDDIVMLAGLGRALAAADDRVAALPIRAQLAERGHFDYEIALIDLALGERDAAIDALERARAKRSGWMIYAMVDPRLAEVRDALSPITAIAL